MFEQNHMLILWPVHAEHQFEFDVRGSAWSRGERRGGREIAGGRSERGQSGIPRLNEIRTCKDRDVCCRKQRDQTLSFRWRSAHACHIPRGEDNGPIFDDANRCSGDPEPAFQ